MSAIIPKSGPTRQLDRPTEPDEQVTEEQAADVPRLARLLMTMLRDVAALKRRFSPHFIDFEDRFIDDATGVTKYRFPHNFGGKVRWWPVDWFDSGDGVRLERHADSDDNTLVLISYAAGTLTLRIEEAA